MSLNLKNLADKFRSVADDRPAVNKLADDTTKANPNDKDAVALCNRFKSSADGAAVRAIADEIDG